MLFLASLGVLEINHKSDEARVIILHVKFSNSDWSDCFYLAFLFFQEPTFIESWKKKSMESQFTHRNAMCGKLSDMLNVIVYEK